ncbi:hypothetical protein BOTBODRAFT_413970 [Botryobasidium botryosum FD-172 SS1]|uniref:Uncharacterized protein n=1 Tax=Botryobasidium botryosum (strain FD-172 SS1) TaxID=930990 RepID=A0A067MAN8_BOTB1|nr:hypothetical protein BOTBODRAFT_413970 [Botryobasidium botryosum FD-172 SS1]
MSHTITRQPLAQTLPHDALLKIFEAYWHTKQQNLRQLGNALRIAHVCGRWRKVAQAYAPFWSHIHLNFAGREVDKQAAHWLGFTKRLNSGIHLYIYSPRREDQPIESKGAARDRLAQLARVLEESMGRWTSISVQLDLAEIKEFFQDTLQVTCAPNLEMVSVELALEPKDPPSLHIPYDRPPHSQANISMKCARCIPILTLNLGWAISKLTMELEDTGVTSNNVLGVLRRCPNLVELLLETFCEYVGEPMSTSTIHLLHLQHISVSGVYDLHNILSLLHLPSLQIFEVRNMEWTDAAVDSILATFQACASSLLDISIGLDEEGYSEDDSDIDLPVVSDPIILASLTQCYFRPWDYNGGNRLLQRLSFPQASRLVIANVGFNIASRTISSCPELRHLTLYDIDENQAPIPVPLLLPHLEALEIMVSTHFLGHLNTPRLERLTIWGSLS